MSKYVLDASALLALLNQEKGKDRVESAVADSVISAVNYCETLGKLIDGGMTDTDAREAVDLINLQVIDFDAGLAQIAAALRPKTKMLGLSLGDRSCLALALVRNDAAITAERAWSKLRIGVKIEVIR